MMTEYDPGHLHFVKNTLVTVRYMVKDLGSSRQEDQLGRANIARSVPKRPKVYR